LEKLKDNLFKKLTPFLKILQKNKRIGNNKCKKYLKIFLIFLLFILST
jgi:hypothetical protein